MEQSSRRRNARAAFLFTKNTSLKNKIMQATYKINLPSLTVDADNAAAKSLLEKSQREFGMVPNMFANLANLPGLLETYWEGRTRFMQQSGFTPAEQEIIFLAVSRE